MKDVLKRYHEQAAAELNDGSRPLRKPSSSVIRVGVAGGLPFNALTTDILSGCLSAKAACYGACWAAREAFKAGVDFAVRVPNRLEPEIIRSDVDKLPATQGHVRCGWNSDASFDWGTAANLAEIIYQHTQGRVITIFLSKAFKDLSDETARRMAAVRSEMWIGIGALDKDGQIKHRFEFLERYRDFGGVAVPVLLSSLYKLQELNDKQAAMVEHIKDKDLPGAENLLRVAKNTAAVTEGIIDIDAYYPVAEGSQLWQGRLYPDLLIVPTISSLSDRYNGGIALLGSQNDRIIMNNLWGCRS